MKFTMDEIEKYSPDTKAGYFSLKNDGDTAKVVFLYNSINDVEGHCVHKVKLKNGFHTYVECLRNYEDPIECCPLCASKVEGDSKLMTKLWIPMYVVANTPDEEDRAVLWERGKNFWKDQLYPLMVEKGEPFCSNWFLIERHGEAGDIETTYEITHTGSNSITLDNFDEIPTPIGTIIQEKTFEELENFVKTRSFDPADIDIPVRRERRDPGDIPVRRGTTRPNIV